jgi:sodium-independent sulfate anion transporter 11
MAPSADQVGRGFAKVLGIKLEEHHHDPVTRGESAYSIDTADSYVEEEPSVVHWLRELVPTPRGVLRWFLSLFPFLNWIGYYNLQWLYGDLVAGITVGAVVVPQSMAYAKLAQLEPAYGLYSSFMGVMLYWFFATSKDITIGVSSRNASAADMSRGKFADQLYSLLLSCRPSLVTLFSLPKRSTRVFLDRSLRPPSL